MSNYIKTPAYPDRMPVDISFVFADEKPAGKHGFLQVSGEEFRFEDGTLARFWGVNFNGGANFPEHDDAEKVARRLAQAGCNIVRFHQLDAEWNTPNIYACTKGRRVSTTRKLDPVSMDRLDYLIFCLKEQGIYVYFDMMTYRHFKSGDGVPYAEELGDSAKPFSIFDRRMIDLQKEFCDQIWNRVNRYTGLAYKDDPVFVMTEITNECDLFRPADFYKLKKKNAPHGAYYMEEFKQLFKAWCEKNGREYDWDNYDMYDPCDAMVDFKLELTKRYYRELYEHMRALGVRIPITGTNYLKNSPCNIYAQQEMDFVDSHSYFYDWRWGANRKCCDHLQITGAKLSPQSRLAYMCVNGKPYFISEWDMPWPNAFRAEGAIYHAAISALQNWSGMIIHSYAYGSRLENMDILGKEVSSDTIGGVPYRSGVFTTWNDPAKFGLFPHAALIVRRCDVTPAKVKVGQTVRDRNTMDLSFSGSGVMDVHRVVTVLPGEQPTGCEKVCTDGDQPQWGDDPDVLVSDNGQLRRNVKKKVAVIDTPRTKAVYGKLASARFAAIDESDLFVDGMTVESKTDFGVVALSSLTDEPIEKSGNLLLSAIGRARNSGAQFDGDEMLDYGHAPILSEVIQAKLSIRTDRTDLKVWGVNPEGYYVGRKEAKFEDGWMTFEVGDTLPASYYLIVAE
ncbi:MAG: hypothetical protein IJT18_07960 [Oscillospiraceae bacterium]|nr:hypothetical protein [Oscillospiraceae bacterium]